MVDYGDIQFRSAGGAIEDCVAGFRYINRETVGAKVSDSGIDGLADAGRVVEKLQMSSANWMEGTGRSWRWGGSQFEWKAKMRSAIYK